MNKVVTLDPINLAPCCCSRDLYNNEGSADQLTHVRKTLEAAHLIRLGARASLAGQLTGLGKKTLKRLHREITGKPSPPGQLPFSDSWFLEHHRRMFHVTLIWHLYKRMNRPACSPARVYIDTFETYTLLVRDPLLNLTRAAFAIQLFTTGAWVEHQCTSCGITFPAPLEHTQTICASCQEYQLYRCRWCDAYLAPKHRGVKREVCLHCGGALN